MTRAPAKTIWLAASTLLAGGIVIVFLAQAASFWHYTNDDAYITYRYARNLAAGIGPYFNPGDHVEGYSNPSLMLLLALIVRLGGAEALPSASKAIGVASGASCVLLCLLLVRRPLASRLPEPSRTILSLGAGGIVAVNPWFAVNSVSGLETALFALCITGALALAALEVAKGRWLGSGLALAATVLTRPEGVAAAGAALLGVALLALRRGALRRALLVNTLIVAAAVVAQLAARATLYDGEWLPNTYYAKAGGIWGMDAWRYLNEGLLAPVFGLAGVAVCVAGLVQRTRQAEVLPVVAVVLFGASLPFIVGVDWMLGWRLVVPFIPSLAVLAVIGWGSLVHRLMPAGLSRPWLPMLALPAALVAVWLTEHPTRERVRTKLAIQTRGYRSGHAALAGWIGRHTRPGDAIALMDIGIVGFRCPDRRILDITGLTDRLIAKSEGDFLDKRYDPGYVLERRPALIVLTLTHPGDPRRPPPPGTRFGFWNVSETRLYRHPEFKRLYRRVRSAGGGHWLVDLAARYGAERIFPHLIPDRRHYLLAVFRRREARPASDHRPGGGSLLAR